MNPKCNGIYVEQGEEEKKIKAAFKNIKLSTAMSLAGLSRGEARLVLVVLSS